MAPKRARGGKKEEEKEEEVAVKEVQKRGKKVEGKVEEEDEAPVAKKGGKRGKKDEKEAEEAEAETKAVGKKGKGKKGADDEAKAPALKKQKSAGEEGGAPELKKEKSEEKEVIEKPELKREQAKGKSLKVISWNVTTLRSLVNKNQAMLKELFDREQPDLVCIQEIKLNEVDQAEYDKKLGALLPGYTFHWSFCTMPDSKSYAGTLAIAKGGEASSAPKAKQTSMDAFLKPKKGAPAPKNGGDAPGNGDAPTVKAVTYGLPTMTDADGDTAKEANAEGRTITVEYEALYVVATYVPNSGDKLQRHAFRTDVWDKRLGEYLKQLETTGAGQGSPGKPVVWCGDLNVAHLDQDIWNVGAKHLVKTPGTTPKERASMSALLEEGGFVDTFRHQHKDVGGWFSYWSVRAGNRPWNRGLRLDYFIASAALLDPAASGPKVVDSYILSDLVALDHAAIALTVQL